MIWFIVSWIIFGLIVGTIAKLIHPGDAEPVGFWQTVAVGIVGSHVGGLIAWVLGMSTSPLAASGFIFSILGGVVSCWIYARYMIYLEQNKDK